MSVGLDLEEIASFVSLGCKEGGTVCSLFNEMDSTRLIAGGRALLAQVPRRDIKRQNKPKASTCQGGSKQGLWVILLPWFPASVIKLSVISSEPFHLLLRSAVQS